MGIATELPSARSSQYHNRTFNFKGEMKISYFLTFLSIISVNVLNAIEIGEQETNLCICSDFTYLNNQGLLVGNCLATLETQFGRRFSGQFCYVHQPHNCPGQTIPSSDLPGMEISF